MNEFISFLNKVSKLSDETNLDLERSIEKMDFDRQEKILESGKTCNHIYFLKKGLVRIFYLKDGKDITEHFATEKNLFGSIDSLVNRKKSELSIETLEKCEVYRLSHSNLENLYENHHDFEKVGRLLSLKAFLTIQERLFSIQFHTATQRYENLVNNHPEIIKRASLGNIASYLGITQVSLSRIRSKQSII